MSESTSDESESESSGSDADPSETSPLPPARPQSPSEAVAYDTIQALWLPRTRSASPEQIRNGLKQYWDVVRPIRDRWKNDLTALKEAEDAKRESEIPTLKDGVRGRRIMMEHALTAALHHGHIDIIQMYVLFISTFIAFDLP